MAEQNARGAVQDRRPPATDAAELPVGELIKRATEQTSRLVREELHLASLEMQAKAKHAGIGLGMFSAAGVVALFGIATLIATAVLALSTALDAWLAALIVAIALLAGAGVMALVGKQQVAEATPPLPEQAIDSVHDDIDEIKARSHR